MTLNNPLALPASFVGLELTVVCCGVLTLWHAVRLWRRGDDFHMRRTRPFASSSDA